METLERQFEQTKQAFLDQATPNVNQRIEQLQFLKEVLLRYQQDIFDSLHQDFEGRSVQDTLLEFLPCINNIDYTIEHLPEWVKSSQRDPGALLSGTSKAKVVYQPKGVVGIISTWNAPIMVTLNPLTTVIATGNRAMIKMSEFTPHFNAVLRTILEEVFYTNEVCIIEGEAEVAAQFSSLPFDHILFTGSSTVGKLVMKAASENLTPVTLELGGKSPVLIDDTQEIDHIVERIIIGKSANNGQLCIAPDYVLLPEDRLDEFVTAYRNYYQKLFPKGVDSEELTSVINERQFKRVQGLMENNESIIPCHENAFDTDHHRMVTHLVIDPSLDSKVMSEEVFGPLLPIITYRDITKALQIILDRPKPLALYIFSTHQSLIQEVEQNMFSGGLCVNDTIFQAAVDDAPFGGVGFSGMGHYHGIEGFYTFSHAKTVLETGDNYQMQHLFTPGNNPLKDSIFQTISQ
ncbi:aldehyde dehydrogenase family protein [Flammeovirga yaeyamensis]|uniref:Aldehyde dehydrogenase n=1 Tax=Flammeovirga yaeyamensis TaxID=367791 RepID=A0AAX1N0P8_9BACT|nr:coniferyl aldehyde dehydrogenase [Flammeovirga yaeyamensis]MBB3700157.1 coniferyl-aldehyde dehydrogenase [Flammeovirga yaeyamensis]NMF37213.1 coniferyl aldehyde dehydrogenase [Flammeovirga yaeyamensis]QWG00902.1 aldehyde dehydrogenase family protein [Flammeovirga yaeyamensis]